MIARRRSGSPFRWWQRHAPALVVVAALVIAATSVGLAFGANSVPDPGWVVTATSATTNLTDAQRVTLNIKSRPDVPIFNITVRQCRAGVTYETSADFTPVGGNCPTAPVSSSADTAVVRGFASHIGDATQSDVGATLTYKVGVGVVTWTTGLDTTATLTCDPTHPCVLVAELSLSGGNVSYSTAPLTFADGNALSACGGLAKGIVSSGGSDQMSDAWASWTQAACQLPGAAGAPTRGSFSGEGSAVTAFAAGDIDLAYTAAGFDSAVALAASGPDPRRAAVAVPVALNAAVIGVGGGFIQKTGDKAPYPEIKVTAAEASGVFGGGVAWVNDDRQPYRLSIIARNPTLGGHVFQTAPVISPMGPSEAESSSWFLTNYFTTLSPADWKDPVSGQARGASAALANADPPFLNLQPFTGRPTLAKVTDLSAQTLSNDGPIWVLTDLATSKALNLTPASLENANGDFVAPTAGSMNAAVSTMKPDENGLLIPDPRATAPSTQASASAAMQPYPLTYVVYALVPAEPIVNDSCVPQTDSQALLTSWLTYLVGAGQENLPAGFQPLPTDLRAEATKAIARVGASPVTGACATAVSALESGSSPAPSALPGLVSGSPPAAALTTPRPSSALASGVTAPSDATAPTKQKEVAIAIPAFAGHRLADTTGGIVALIGIVLVTSLAAWVTSGYGLGGPTTALAGAGGGSVTRSGGRPNAVALVALWIGVAIAGFGLVVYQLGPMLQQSDQRELLNEYRTTVRHAANESSGLPGVQVSDKPPNEGSAVGIVEIGALEAQQVVVEGVTASETQKGPGHVPGTAGLGQPGNSVVLARRNAFGGSFRDLSQLRKGDRILVTTTQGQSVYVVKSVRTRTIVDGSSSSSSSASYVTAATANKGEVALDTLYGPTNDDRLTLVTSATRAPWNSSDAAVVVAKMQGKPFEPTPQGARSDAETGMSGESGAWASVVLVLLLFGGAIAASVVLFQRMRFRVAYLLVIAPLVALTVIAGETLSRLLPAWM